MVFSSPDIIQEQSDPLWVAGTVLPEFQFVENVALVCTDVLGVTHPISTNAWMMVIFNSDHARLACQSYRRAGGSGMRLKSRLEGLLLGGIGDDPVVSMRYSFAAALGLCYDGKGVEALAVVNECLRGTIIKTEEQEEEMFEIRGEEGAVSDYAFASVRLLELAADLEGRRGNPVVAMCHLNRSWSLLVSNYSIMSLNVHWCELLQFLITTPGCDFGEIEAHLANNGPLPEVGVLQLCMFINVRARLCHQAGNFLEAERFCQLGVTILSQQSQVGVKWRDMQELMYKLLQTYYEVDTACFPGSAASFNFVWRVNEHGLFGEVGDDFADVVGILAEGLFAMVNAGVVTPREVAIRHHGVACLNSIIHHARIDLLKSWLGHVKAQALECLSTGNMPQCLAHCAMYRWTHALHRWGLGRADDDICQVWDAVIGLVRNVAKGKSNELRLMHLTEDVEVDHVVDQYREAMSKLDEQLTSLLVVESMPVQPEGSLVAQARHVLLSEMTYVRHVKDLQSLLTGELFNSIFECLHMHWSTT